MRAELATAFHAVSEDDFDSNKTMETTAATLGTVDDTVGDDADDDDSAVVAPSSTDDEYLETITNREARTWWREYIGQREATYVDVQDATIAWMLKTDSTLTHAQASIVAATVCFGIDRDRDGEITHVEFATFSQDLGDEYSVSKLREYEVSRKCSDNDVDDEKVREYAEFLGIDPETETDLFWIAACCMNAPLPRGWEEFTDDDTGGTYFYNEAKSKTTWDHPLDSHVRTIGSCSTKSSVPV